MSRWITGASAVCLWRNFLACDAQRPTDSHLHVEPHSRGRRLRGRLLRRADMPSPASPQTLLALLDIELPIVQAPMAGVSSPAMAAAVGNAGALGSIGVGAKVARSRRSGLGPRPTRPHCFVS